MTVETFRALVRPAIALGFAILVALMFWTEKAIPDLLRLTWLAIIGEWIGERLLFKLLKNGKA